MSFSPFAARPMAPGSLTPEAERRRARLVVAICVVGIAAALLAYAISPGVRHAVGHAAHSVRHEMSHVFDPDHAPARSAQGGHARLVTPLHTGTAGKTPLPAAAATRQSPAPAP